MLWSGKSKASFTAWKREDNDTHPLCEVWHVGNIHPLAAVWTEPEAEPLAGLFVPPRLISKRFDSLDQQHRRRLQVLPLAQVFSAMKKVGHWQLLVIVHVFGVRLQVVKVDRIRNALLSLPRLNVFGVLDVSDQVSDLYGDARLVAGATDRVVSGVGHAAPRFEPLTIAVSRTKYRACQPLAVKKKRGLEKATKRNLRASVINQLKRKLLQMPTYGLSEIHEMWQIQVDSMNLDTSTSWLLWYIASFQQLTLHRKSLGELGDLPEG